MAHISLGTRRTYLCRAWTSDKSPWGPSLKVEMLVGQVVTLLTTPLTGFRTKLPDP